MASVKDSLFGMMAVRAGFVTEEQVQEIIDLQQQYSEKGGTVPRMGELLAQKGYMTADQVKAVLAGQHREKGGLFGEIAIRWNFATREQVDECLEVQKEERQKGNPRKLGEIMLYKGYIQVQQIAAVLEAQKRRVLQCSGCGKHLSTAGFRPGDKLKCGGCGAVTEVPAVPGFTTADFRPVEAEVTPAETREQAEQAPPPGEPKKVEIGGYEIISRLGQDAAGTTLKARHLATDTTVVLRVMRVTPMQDEAFLKRFIEQGKNATKLIHKNIKRIHEVGLDKGRYYYSTEFVEGKSLKRMLDEGHRFSALEAVDLLLKVAHALEYAHNNGTIHGDLRPPHIILTDDGSVKIAEIGIAKDVSANLRYFARSSSVIPLYVAPEVAVDEETAGPASDIYSLGAIFYHMLTGSPPYEGTNPLEVLMRISEEEAPSPHRMGVTTEGLSRVAMKMIAPEPEDRYRSMTEVIDALREHMRDAALSTSRAKPKGTAEKAHERARRRAGGALAAEELRAGRGGMRPLTWFLFLLFLLVAAAALAWNFGVLDPKYWSTRWQYNVGVDGTSGDAKPESQPAEKLSEDELAFKELLSFVGRNPDNPEICLLKIEEFREKYPTSVKAADAARMALAQKEKVGRRAHDQLVKEKEDYAARNDFIGAVQAYDDWLERFAGTDLHMTVFRERKQLVMVEEKDALEREIRKAKWAAGEGKEEDALALLNDFRASKTHEARRLEAVEEVKRILASRQQAEEAAPVPEEPAPEEPAPEEPAPQPVAEVEEDLGPLNQAIAKAVKTLDSAAILGAVGDLQLKSRAGRLLLVEARDVAGLIGTTKDRLAKGIRRGLTVRHGRSQDKVTNVDDKGVTLRVNQGGRIADVTVPWPQLPPETIEDLIYEVVGGNDAREYALVAALFLYLGETGRAEIALSRALGLGYSDQTRIGARLKEMRERPSTGKSGTKEPIETSAALPERIAFRDEHDLGYLEREGGTWQIVGNALRVHGDVCKAVLRSGRLKGFLIRFEFKEVSSRLDVTVGRWRMGLDGFKGALVIRDTAGIEKETPYSIVSGFEYEMRVEATGDGTLYILQGTVKQRDKSTEPQGDSLVITAKSGLGVEIKEIRILR